MQIRVQYLGLVRRKVGEKEEEFEIREGASLSDLLDEMAKAHQQNLKGLLDAEKGNIIDPTYIVTINGILADQLKGMKTKLHNGDEVALMTLIGGG